MDKLKHILNLIKKSIPPIHPAGHIFIFIAIVVTIILGMMSDSLGWVGVIITAWVVYFFRDPFRYVPQGEDLIISPADGAVCLIDLDINGPKELNLPQDLKFNRVSIFLNVFDVHVNRIPVSGVVSDLNYHPGKFLSADLDKASEDNERQSIVIDTKTGRKIVCVQIAGMVAKRIVCDLSHDMDVVAGQRYGIIKFGSRLDVYMPIDILPQVAIGQRMVAGETIIADMKSKKLPQVQAIKI